MDMEMELRRLCTNLAVELLSKGRAKYSVDLGTIMDYAKTYYLLAKSMETSDR